MNLDGQSVAAVKGHENLSEGVLLHDSEGLAFSKQHTHNYNYTVYSVCMCIYIYIYI